MQSGGPQILGGPVWWFFVVAYVLTLGLAAYVSVDSWRTVRSERLAALREPSWLYRVLQPAFLALALLVWLPFVPRIIAVIPVGLMPFALAGQIAYLLRVVFPRPAASATDAGAEEIELLADGGDTVEPEAPRAFS